MIERANEYVDTLLSRIAPDGVRLALGRKRQGAVSRGERPDYLPICFVKDFYTFTAYRILQGITFIAPCSFSYRS